MGPDIKKIVKWKKIIRSRLQLKIEFYHWM